MLAIDKTIANISAAKKPSTLNPATILLTKSMSKAFKIKVKRPSVKIFIGRVRIRRIGLRSAFIIPSTNATTKADVKSETFTPGSM